MSYQIVAVSEEISRKVRKEMRSPQYGHPAFVEVAKGYGPCRSCLRKFDEGREERILFTYNPFEGLSDLPLPGPVFIHGADCERYEKEGFPEELLDLPLLFEGFGETGRLETRVGIDRSAVDDQIRAVLDTPGVDYIYVRNAEAGCFVARIDPLNELCDAL